jgi:transcriptional regulator with XRE-family HTH domain
MGDFAGSGGMMPRGAPRLRADDGRLNLVGERVRSRRAGLRLTQDALCATIARYTNGGWNPDRREIFKIEEGVRSVHDTEIIALAVALECSPCWLLTGMRYSKDP